MNKPIRHIMLHGATIIREDVYQPGTLMHEHYLNTPSKQTTHHSCIHSETEEEFIVTSWWSRGRYEVVQCENGTIVKVRQNPSRHNNHKTY